MKTSDEVIITCAVTGAAHDRRHCPYTPYTPVEIADECLRAYNAGASVVHVHAREDDGQPSWRAEVFREIKKEITERCPIITCFSTGGMAPKEERIAYFDEATPEMAALNVGAMSYAKYRPNKKDFAFSLVYANPIEDTIFFLEAMNKHGILPECECYDIGHLEMLLPLIDMGLLKDFRVSLIMGQVGIMLATYQNLMHAVSIVPKGISWEVITFREEAWPMVGLALAMGGEVRVGIEDNYYLSEGVMAEGNGPLVEKAVRMAREIDREPATVDEARAILRLKQPK